jgi:hypothetical protein
VELLTVEATARAVALSAALALAACAPEIGAGTYFCGPEMLCAPDLACDPNTFTCERPGSFEPFACPAGSEIAEPDDDDASARDLGALACGFALESAAGCIDDGDDVDLVRFELPASCSGQTPRLELEVHFPVALAPLDLAVTGPDGDEVDGEPCTPDPNYSGMDWSCVSIPSASGSHRLRVRMRTDDPGGDDAGSCDGECRFNQYLLYLRVRIA